MVDRLTEIFNTAHKTTESIKEASKHKVGINEFVKYAHRVGGTTGACPPCYLSPHGEAPQFFRFPYPSAPDMWTTRLHASMLVGF